MLYPDTVEVLADQLNVTEWLTCAPVPDSAMVLGDDAVLVTVTEPVSLPATLGLKITLNVVLCPALRLTGVLAPVIANPVPLSLICEIVTFEFPEFVKVTFCVAVDPIFTFPKAILVVLKVKACVAATPVPLSAIAAGEFGALLTMLTLPVTTPAAAGLHCTLKLLVWPGVNVIGRANLPMLNPVPVTLTWLTANVPVPVFCNWMVCEAGEPAVTVPKFALDGVIPNAGCTPFPETAMTAFAPCVLASVMFPVMFSDTFG